MPVQPVPAHPEVPLITLVRDPERALPALASIRGRILRQPDDTAWLVSPAGSRLWIPDADTWTCLTRENTPVLQDLRGYAVATLPFAGQAHCPDTSVK